MQLCFVATISLSIIEGFTFLSISKRTRFARNCTVLIAIFYFCRCGLQYGETNKGNFYLTLSIGSHTDTIDMKHVVVLKAIDLSLWFAVQFVRNIRYPDSIKWQRITREWK